MRKPINFNWTFKSEFKKEYIPIFTYKVEDITIKKVFVKGKEVLL